MSCEVAKALFDPHPGRGKKCKRVEVKRGVCAYEGCPLLCGEPSLLPKRSPYRCGSCAAGAGAYYHLPCFFACHRCLMK